MTDADIKRIHDQEACLPDLVGMKDQWPEILRFARAVLAAAAPVAACTLTDEQCEAVIEAVRSVFGGVTYHPNKQQWSEANQSARNLIRAALSCTAAAPVAANRSEEAWALLRDIAKWNRGRTSLPNRVKECGSIGAFNVFAVDLWKRFDAAMGTDAEGSGTALSGEEGRE